MFFSQPVKAAAFPDNAGIPRESDPSGLICHVGRTERKGAVLAFPLGGIHNERAGVGVGVGGFSASYIDGENPLKGLNFRRVNRDFSSVLVILLPFESLCLLCFLHLPPPFFFLHGGGGVTTVPLLWGHQYCIKEDNLLQQKGMKTATCRSILSRLFSCSWFQLLFAGILLQPDARARLSRCFPSTSSHPNSAR